MLVAILSVYLGALSAPWIHRRAPNRSALILAIFPALLAAYFFSLLQRAAEGAAVTESRPWFPAQGVYLAFTADGLGALFATIISAAGALVTVYSGAYLRGHPQQGRFFAYLLAFMASMLGLVLSDDVICLFVFWELTSITSYLLIGFKHEDDSSRASALQALLVTAGGGLLLLAGLVMLAEAGGTSSITKLVAQSATLGAHELFVPSLCLIVIAALTKSAQFPFHFWLPNAMAAPTPVSAYLHSATMVKAGVYLLCRLLPVFGENELWYWLLTASGGITMVFGAAAALQQSDLKLCLAYSTLSVLGALTLLLGDGSRAAVEAALLLIVSHAAYKGALFLVVGCIDHELGTRDVSRLSGLRRCMPITAFAAVAAALSMAGVPPLLGFVSKELLYAVSLERGTPLAPALAVASVSAYALLVAVACIVGIRPFFGRRGGYEGARKEPPRSMWMGPLLLSMCGACTLWAPGLSRVVGSAAAAVRPGAAPTELSIWHGPNLAFWLSIMTLGAGVAIFTARHRLIAVTSPLRALGRWGPRRAYSGALAGLSAAASAQIRVLHPGYLRYYVKFTIAAAIALVAAAFFQGNAFQVPDGGGGLRFHELAIAAVVLVSAVAATVSNSRLTAVVALGAVGYGIALLYVVFSAPDLALTQFAVETLSVIVFLLVVYRLPPFVQPARRASRLRDGILAGASGLMMTLLVLAATAVRADSSVSQWLAANSYPLGNGRNVVNVILVDFRALDTLGEITVLAVAAIGVFGLMKLRLDSGERR